METLMPESNSISLSEEKFSSLMEGDLETFSALFDEKGLMFYPNGKVETKPELLERLKSKKTVFLALDLKKCISRSYGTTSVVHGEGLFTINLQGEELSEKLNFIDVWVERENGWKLVSSHFIKMV
ncbi:nuclear transport factor 2 family protein [Algoriphagus sp. AK58]|uniref:nuclear transport factor 2 family protein n=1 Tax=Algoriphagus sp. AK58 TaxID=1406877 RepID=UPI00164F5DC9|nr:nuclear transport factor 2 family protein [Algoriphagus sp. AK58]